jgi:hypothetical protein
MFRPSRVHLQGGEKVPDYDILLCEYRMLIQSCSSEDEDEDGGEELRFWCEFA